MRNLSGSQKIVPLKAPPIDWEDPAIANLVRQ